MQVIESIRAFASFNGVLQSAVNGDKLTELDKHIADAKELLRPYQSIPLKVCVYVCMCVRVVYVCVMLSRHVFY